MMPAIRRDVPIPFYYQLQRMLEEHIESGTWGEHDLLPSEAELCSTYQVSRTVVRQALGELVTMGLLYRVKGKGTFVAPRKVRSKYIQRAEGFYAEMTALGKAVRSNVLVQQVVEPSAQVRLYLELQAGEQTVQIDRLRFVDEQPLHYVHTFLPSALCPDLEHMDVAKGSLYGLLRDRFGLAVASGRRTVEAVSAQRPLTTLLRVPKGSPLLRMESISYLENGRPLEYYEAWHDGSHSRFEIEMVVGGRPASGETRRGRSPFA